MFNNDKNNNYEPHQSLCIINNTNEILIIYNSNLKLNQ